MENYTGAKDIFEHALSNFMFDAASGGAIRHLVDKGHSVEQIMGELDFPTPRDRVEKTVYQYMKDSRLLLVQPPFCLDTAQKMTYTIHDSKSLQKLLLEHIHLNEKENSYLECPFRSLVRCDLSYLTKREQEYLTGIPFEPGILYHRLNSRMFDIGLQLALHATVQISFLFSEERLRLQIIKKQ